MVDAKKYKKLRKVKLLRLIKGGGAKVEKEVTLYEARHPMKHRLYYFPRGKPRVRVIVTSGWFYGLPTRKGLRYVRRWQKGETKGSWTRKGVKK